MPDAALRVWPVDETTHSYVADKGPFTHLELENWEDETSLTFHTFRLFAFQIGFAINAGVPGRYLVNTAADMDADDPVSSFDLTLPALVVPHDPGQPPVIGLYWKVKANGKKYAQTIPTDLKLSEDSSTQAATWLTDEATTPMKFELLREVKPLASQDGNNLPKRFDEWLKNASDYFKARALRTQAACRAWLSHSSYALHMKSIMTIAQQSTRAEVMAAYGIIGKGTKPGQKTVDAEKAAKAEAETKWATFLRAVAPFERAVAAASVPIGHRIIELNLPFVIDEDELSDDDLMTLLKEAAPDKFTTILDLIKDKGKYGYSLLRNQEAEALPPLSPNPAAPDVPDVPAPAEPPDSKKGKEKELPKRNEVDLTGEGSGSVEGKRERVPPQRLDAGRSPPVKKAKKEKQAAPAAAAPAVTPTATPASAPEPVVKRKYEKTGKYAKDPIASAMAKASGKSPPGSAAQASPAPVTQSQADFEGERTNSNSN